MSIVASVALIGLAVWAAAWTIVIVGMAVVKLTDFVTSHLKGKWQ